MTFHNGLVMIVNMYLIREHLPTFKNKIYLPLFLKTEIKYQ
jgi:hypothetical protein